SWTNEWVSFARHSQSLLVTLMYAMYEEAAGRLSGDWHRGGFAVPLIGSLFDDEIATTVGIKKGVTGGAAPADQNRTMIAYSAIDDGTRPFGDTGIRALFNDAQDIGKALGAENASQVLKDAANPLSNIITQFAGQLAFGDVLASSTQCTFAAILVRWRSSRRKEMSELKRGWGSSCNRPSADQKPRRGGS